MLPKTQAASVTNDPVGRLDLEGGDVAPSPFDDPPCDEPVSFIEERPGQAAPDEGVSEFVEPPEASELSEPPHCP
jgi:hypothetical protein